MKIIKGETLFGFTIQRIREIPELNGELVEMTHDKTGAALCWMRTEEQNKLFSVAFQTVPEDSTGVFHILEHSVLNGSERFPVKEPFVELLKSSMNTFLNAMTFPDKTMYPVSSRNEKDFLNLMSVYLDAVFAPRILENPNIFYQEGIHVELGEAPSYKGVVFNEMKGAMSNVDNRIEESMSELLFPDTCYRFNSGGNPAKIPDLTYERFLDTYKRFYHPSNARFYLDGAIPIEETLTMIGSYLERYEKREGFPEISFQAPVAVEGSARFEIEPEDSTESRAVLALGKIFGTWEEKTKIYAAKVLCDVLAGSNESPLKRAVLSSGLAEDMELTVMDGLAQPYILLIVRNMKEENSASLLEIIQNTVQRIVTEGLDKKALSASINLLAYHSKQKPEPQGVYRAISALNSWLYGGDPLLYLTNDQTIAELRKMVETSDFEKLLETLLLKEEGRAVLHMLPSVTLGDEERKAEEKRVQAEVDALTEAELRELRNQNEALLQWQKTPDSPENIATLPALSLSEVSETPELTVTQIHQEGEVTVLTHPLTTQGIVYLSMYFPMTQFRLEELAMLSLYPGFYGELPTERHSVLALQQEIKNYIGSLSFSLDVHGPDREKEKCTPCLVVRAGMLEENLDQAKALIREILLETRFDDIDKIREFVMQANEMSRQTIVSNGHLLGFGAVQSHYSAKGAVNEALSGYTSIRFLRRFASDFENVVEDFLSLVHRASDESISRTGLVASVTSTHPASFTDLFEALPAGKPLPKASAYRTELPRRMGIRIPAQIAYALKGYRLSECGMEMNGGIRVVSNILSLAYLWNAVRVQGGAYGAGFPIGRDGGLVCYSYRDPSPARSLKIYDALADFMQEFRDGDEDLEKYIISAVALTEGLHTPAEQGAIADELRFAGVSDADRILNRKQMLSIKRENLTDWNPALQKMAEDGAVCVVGPEEALRECEGLEILEL